MLIEALVVGPLQVNCYIVGCAKTRQAAVIDPGDDGEQILAALAKAGLQLRRSSTPTGISIISVRTIC